jgi:hypothetical protein
MADVCGTRVPRVTRRRRGARRSETLKRSGPRDEGAVENCGELRRYLKRARRRRRARLGAVQGAAQSRGFDPRPVALHPRPGAAVHLAPHGTLFLTCVQGDAGQRAAGHEQEKEQRCEPLPHRQLETILSRRDHCQGRLIPPGNSSQNRTHTGSRSPQRRRRIDTPQSSSRLHTVDVAPIPFPSTTTLL